MCWITKTGRKGGSGRVRRDIGTYVALSVLKTQERVVGVRREKERRLYRKSRSRAALVMCVVEWGWKSVDSEIVFFALSLLFPPYSNHIHIVLKICAQEGRLQRDIRRNRRTKAHIQSKSRACNIKLGGQTKKSIFSPTKEKRREEDDDGGDQDDDDNIERCRFRCVFTMSIGNWKEKKRKQKVPWFIMLLSLSPFKSFPTSSKRKESKPKQTNKTKISQGKKRTSRLEPTEQGYMTNRMSWLEHKLQSNSVE
ncbi:unnamed protein product [Orchesella dallaii]|uniref:Uncharacterized protein n=1 Tax=Orchesella dallaii TaxID=48710 RepID=A0ABP1R5Z0_9HEXA